MKITEPAQAYLPERWRAWGKISKVFDRSKIFGIVSIVSITLELSVIP